MNKNTIEKYHQPLKKLFIDIVLSIIYKKIYTMKITIITALFILFQIQNANAYIGIAALLPIFGQAIIFVIIFLIALVGLLLYPAKSLINKISKRKTKTVDKRKP